MTYIDYLNRFNQWTENNDLPLYAVVLYYRLLDRFNRAGWPRNLRVDTLRLMLMAGCQKDAAYRARDKLAEAGFIRFEKGAKGKPTTYFLSEILSFKTTESATETPTVSPTETATVLPTQRERNKTKTKTPPKPPRGVCEDGFEKFWQAYPKKTAKQAALKAWAKLSPDKELLGTILAAVERDKQSDQWQRDGKQYIPYPATWLNGRRWEDEPDGPDGPPGGEPVEYGPREMLPDTHVRLVPEDASDSDIWALF